MDNKIINLLLARAMNDPRIANNPNAQEMINVIRSGDNAKGEQIAQNLCNSYGVSKEQAVSQAKNFFGFK